MSSRQERTEAKQRHKIKAIIIAFVIVLIMLICGIGWGLSHQLNKSNKMESASSMSNVSSEENAKLENSSSMVDSTSDSAGAIGSSEDVMNSNRSEGDDVTAHETKMLRQRQEIVLGINKSVYYDRSKDTPNFSYMTEIPHGFTVYFDNGNILKVKEVDNSEGLADDYKFEENQGWQVEADGENIFENIILEKPSGMGGAGYPSPTEEELHQYGIR
ncbi:hypothetical protein [Weissella fangxianensis]|uniref:hypothetical protein n=1 Tax=Weissella fangxianensis TaxID=2953879 RepID=UPI0021577601|nr:hypothetical protein [Weissella fangxianensis]